MPNSDYDEFEARVKRLGNLQQAQKVLRWDQEVMMPTGGTPARSDQLSTLSGLQHEILTDEKTGRLLKAVSENELGDPQTAVVREITREHERARAVPRELVEEISREVANAHDTWKEARRTDSFETFAPSLRRLVELNRDYAAHVDPDRDPYAVLLEEYEPYLGLETAERVLEQLQSELVSLIDALNGSDPVSPEMEAFELPADRQEKCVRTALDRLGYEWEHGRLDTAPHPFSTGNMFDARITTRYEKTAPFESLLSAIHEFGHALYTRGLPGEAYGTPLGDPRDMTIHESQSRFWENHIGRSREFWEFFLPVLQEEISEFNEFDVEDIYQQVNRVYPENLIRVEADELTYHLHILVRFEIERDLIRGDVDVDEVPQIWNDKMEAYLGIRPETDTDGCLQDIHWSHGSFGYFPTYSLGSMLAAQLAAEIATDIPDYSSLVEQGEFTSIREWLRENIHQFGCQFETGELIERATGESLTAEYYLEYVRAKFGELYDL